MYLLRMQTLQKQKHVTIPNFKHIKSSYTTKNISQPDLSAPAILPRCTLRFGTAHDFQKDQFRQLPQFDSTQESGTALEHTFYFSTTDKKTAAFKALQKMLNQPDHGASFSNDNLAQCQHKKTKIKLITIILTP